MPTSLRYVRSDAVVARAIGQETLIVPVRGGIGDLASIYSLNTIGSLVWEVLANPKNTMELVDLVTTEYEVDWDQAQQDVERFLADLQSVGLITIAGDEESHDGQPIAEGKELALGAGPAL